ncbi:MAG: hypothetical protein WCK73_14010 [Deltaproteobacteria bacterium]
MRWQGIAAVAILAAAPPLGAKGADDPGVSRLEILVGQEATVSGGPIRELICDDGALVSPSFTPDGVALKGLRAGTTLCSFRDAASVRKVLRVVVRESPPQGGSGASSTGGS